MELNRPHSVCSRSEKIGDTNSVYARGYTKKAEEKFHIKNYPAVSNSIFC